jgi:hypothetical protein
LLHASVHDICHRKDHRKFHENRSSGSQFEVVGVRTDRVGFLISQLLPAAYSLKNDGEFLPVHSMNECMGVKVYFHALLTTALNGGE